MMQRPIYKNIPPYNERLVIIKDGVREELLFPYSITGIGDIKRRIKDAAKGYNHGSDVTGDKKVESRKIKIGLDVRGHCEEEHDKAINTIYKFFSQEDYLLVTGRRDRAYSVAGAPEIKQKYRKGFKQRWSEIDITLLLADPFRYAVQESKKKIVFSEAQENTVIQINNPGNIDAPLRIKLSPEIAMPDVNIFHDQTGYSCRIRDSLLTTPKSLVIDTKAGTVIRGTDNAINTQSGQFLSAVPGRNTYKITCLAGNIEIYFTERWLL